MCVLYNVEKEDEDNICVRSYPFIRSKSMAFML